MTDKYVLPKFIRKIIWKYFAKFIKIKYVHGSIYDIYAYYYLGKYRIATIDVYTYLVNFD